MGRVALQLLSRGQVPDAGAVTTHAEDRPALIDDAQSNHLAGVAEARVADQFCGLESSHIQGRDGLRPGRTGGRPTDGSRLGYRVRMMAAGRDHRSD
jgi:hypothetical protein